MMIMDIDGMKIMNNGLHLVSIETAIKLLRPEAKFELNNMIFTRWEHSQDPPSWDEINNMMSIKVWKLEIIDSLVFGKF